MASIKDMDFLDGADEDFVSAGPQKRNWRGIVVALFSIGIMSATIIAAIFILTPFGIDGDGLGDGITLAELFSPRFQAPSESVEWLDQEKLWVKKADGIDIIDLRFSSSANHSPMSTESYFRYGKASSLQVSAGGRYITLGYSASKKPQHQTYKIFDTETRTFENVGPTKTGNDNVRNLVWNPTKTGFAYVYGNNVYYQTDPAKSESVQITKDGSPDILNGIADWLYQEEILQTSKALWWSSDGNYLAFLSIDNQKVAHASINLYGRRQYPRSTAQSYPKAGANELPEVRLRIWRLADNLTRSMRIRANDNFLTYLFSASWIKLYGKQVLAAVWANRFQNTTLTALCTFESGECSTGYVQRYEFDENLKLWAEPEDTAIRFHTDSAYFTLLPHRRPNGDVYTQVARIELPPSLVNGKETFLPSDDYDIVKIDAFDKQTDKIYFTAAAPLPTQRNLFSTSAGFKPQASRDRSAEGSAVCLSCDEISNCTFIESQFPTAVDGKWPLKYVNLHCKGPGTPRNVVARLDNDSLQLKPEMVFGFNQVLDEALRISHKFPSVRYETIKLKSGIETYVKLFFPPNMHKADAKLPLLVDSYSGPGSQRVTEQFSSSLETFFSSNQEYVVAFIDGRGSGYRGWKRRQPLYGNIGTVEVEDQIETARCSYQSYFANFFCDSSELLKRYPFLDPRKVGIWGWSYGGFVAAKDTTYVERYMGNAENEKYEQANVLNGLKAFHNVSFLLVHGTADDNVHFQNTADLARALIDENVQFEMMVYPDESHNLAQGRWHLYNLLASFFKRCFSKSGNLLPHK